MRLMLSWKPSESRPARTTSCRVCEKQVMPLPSPTTLSTASVSAPSPVMDEDDDETAVTTESVKKEMEKWEEMCMRWNDKEWGELKKDWRKKTDNKKEKYSYDDFAVFVWASNVSAKCPHLSKVARMFLGMPASSVASERAFSTARLIDTRLLSQLGDELFADLLFITKNMPESRPSMRS